MVVGRARLVQGGVVDHARVGIHVDLVVGELAVLVQGDRKALFLHELTLRHDLFLLDGIFVLDSGLGLGLCLAIGLLLLGLGLCVDVVRILILVIGCSICSFAAAVAGTVCRRQRGPLLRRRRNVKVGVRPEIIVVRDRLALLLRLEQPLGLDDFDVGILGCLDLAVVSLPVIELRAHEMRSILAHRLHGPAAKGAHQGLERRLRVTPGRELAAEADDAAGEGRRRGLLGLGLLFGGGGGRGGPAPCGHCVGGC